MWWSVVLVIAALVAALKVYQKLTVGVCHSSAHMVGKVVVVTGGNSGLGFEVANDLAARGARVIIACRSERRGDQAVERIKRLTCNQLVTCYPLDLSSFRSVRAFAAHVIANEPRLDVLINNAGAGGLGNYRTEDNLHVGMQVNYFSPWLLTCLLLPLLKASAPTRIVNVSSLMHKYGELDFDNLNMELYWSDYLVYANTKLFLIMMSVELSRRLAGTGVTVNSLHPGVAPTNIFRNIPSRLIRRVVERVVGFIFQTPWEAAQTTIFLAAAPKVASTSGKYFANCKVTKASKIAQNPELARRLWDETEKLAKFTLPEQQLQ